MQNLLTVDKLNASIQRHIANTFEFRVYPIQSDEVTRYFNLDNFPSQALLEREPIRTIPAVFYHANQQLGIAEDLEITFDDIGTQFRSSILLIVLFNKEDGRLYRVRGVRYPFAVNGQNSVTVSTMCQLQES